MACPTSRLWGMLLCTSRQHGDLAAGEAAEALLQQIAPGADVSSLADAFACGPVAVGSDAVALLGRQQQWVAGAAVSCYLLLRTRPASLLTAPQVGLPPHRSASTHFAAWLGSKCNAVRSRPTPQLSN